MTSSWTVDPKPISGVLLDITGVLYESGEGHGTAIPGSADAFKRLKAANIPVRLVTNETTQPRQTVAAKLQHHGFPVTISDIFSPIPAVCALLRERGDRPHLLVHPDVVSEFDEFSKEDPTCVVVGDCFHDFSFENMNKAFNALIKMDKPRLYSLGKGKYYKHKGSLHLDLGAFTAALEYACDVQAEVVGKPSQNYFAAALKELNVSQDEVVMVGDDICSDVGGAQQCGMRGVLVRTGKFTPANENHAIVKPNCIVDNLAQAVDIMAQNLKWQ